MDEYAQPQKWISWYSGRKGRGRRVRYSSVQTEQVAIILGQNKKQPDGDMILTLCFCQLFVHIDRLRDI